MLGADGVHSVVREYILGPWHPARYLKQHDSWQVFRTIVPAEVARQRMGGDRFTRGVSVMTGPRGHVNCVPLSRGTRISLGVAVRGGGDPATWGEDGEPRLDASAFADYHPWARQVVALVAAGPTVTWTLGDHDNAEVYHRGRVAMLGDAAHAALPFAGGGAGQALEDAAVLNRVLGVVESVDDLEAALRTFTMVRLGRTQRVVELSRSFGRVYAHAEEQVGSDKEAIGRFLRESDDWMNDFDVQIQSLLATWAFFAAKHLAGELVRPLLMKK